MKNWLGLLCFGLVLLVPRACAQVPSEKADTTFKVVDGLQMRLWASEPLFVNPTCMDVDHKGRVWVCESVNYRTSLHRRPLNRPAGDRIVILEDTKGTGRADKAITFYQSPELLAPLGIAVAKDPVGPGYKVFVCQSPDILLFEDKDGDGKADGPPKKLLSGFRGIDHDHGVHGILIGPDMKLYFSVGDQGVSGLQSSDGKGRKWSSNSTDCRAGTIWRCDLDGKNLELIAHNFRNEYEPCVDSFGTVFVSDNDDDGNQQTRICYVMPSGDYGYHPRGRGESHWHEEKPGVVPKILRTYFGSPTGMCVYEGTLLPKKYWGQLLHTDAGPRHVRCYHLKANGASYDVEREDLVTSTDNWFRPSDICVAPDGSVFVADWYDPGVGGHGMGDTTRGRVYRITPAGYTGTRMPKVDLKSKKGLLAALGSPNRAVRYMAMAKLRAMATARDRSTQEARDALELAINQKDNPWLRARGFWHFALLGNHFSGEFPAALIMAVTATKDKDARFRCLGIRMMADVCSETLANLGKLDEVGLKKLVHDPSAAVRREILLSLREENPTKARPFIYELMKQYDGKDRFYLAAIGIAVGHHDRARRDVILADFSKHFPEWNDKVANLIWELRPPKVLPLLEKRLTDAKVPAEQRARIVDILAASDDRAAGSAILQLLAADVPAEVRERALANLELFLPGKWQHLKKEPAFDRTIGSLLAKPATRATGLALIALAGKPSFVPEAAKVAAAKDEALPVRKAAVAALGKLPDERSVEALRGLLGTTPPALRSDVVAALGELARVRGFRAARRPGAAAALKALQGLAQDGKADLVLRQAAVTALSASRQGTVWLLSLHARGQLPEALRGETARLLRNSPYPDLRNRALVAFPPPGKLNLKKLPPLAVLADRRGDAARGKALLAASLTSNLQCLKCHTVRGVGGQVGPDLSVIGKKASRENLFESILYPSKAIADQYVTWQVQTSKGLSLSGLIVEEKPEYVILRDAEGRDTRVRTRDIEKRSKTPKSLMPDDLAAYLSEAELVDLVEYLFALKTPALSVDSWHIIGPFDNGAGDAGLDRVYPPEKAIDLKGVYAGKGGKVRWTTVKPGAGGYVDLRAFFAGRSDNIASYLTREVESPAAQEATVLLGTDDGAKLWVNGKQVFSTRAHRAALPEQDRVKVRLHKGVNRIVLKIVNGAGPHGFYFTVLVEQELKLRK
jgi:putative membrane-bound dehydrogenase-like protein